MDTYHALLVDDEPLALDVLAQYLGRLPNFRIAGRAANALEAFALLQSTTVDVLFLDIQMPGIDGLGFLRSLPRAPRTILTTAYPNYALEGFELDVVDYLLKPIPFERFMLSIHKLMRSSAATPAMAAPDNSQAFIYLKQEKHMQKVLLQDILYIESQKNYIKVVCTHKTVLSPSPLSAIEQRLPESRFLRIHRSYLVALDKIEAFDASTLTLQQYTLPIGRHYKDTVFRRLQTDDYIF